MCIRDQPPNPLTLSPEYTIVLSQILHIYVLMYTDGELQYGDLVSYNCGGVVFAECVAVCQGVLRESLARRSTCIIIIITRCARC